MALATVLSAVAAWVSAGWAFRIRFERFDSMDSRREEEWKEWRKGIDAMRIVHSSRMEIMERTIVTRSDLDKSLEQMRADRLEMHEENRKHLERIEAKLDADRKTMSGIAMDVAVLVNGGRVKR